MTVTRYERWLCRCGHPLDCATSLDDSAAVPKPGDLTLCLYCAELYVLDPNRLWRPITDDELIDLPLDDKKQISALQIRLRRSRLISSFKRRESQLSVGRCGRGADRVTRGSKS